MRFFSAIIVFLSIFISNAQAQTFVGSVPIAAIRTGWASDTFAIDTAGAYVNPANCPVADGYYSKTGDSGYKTFYAAVLMAFAMGKNVNVIISNTECSESRPRIIGLTIVK